MHPSLPPRNNIKHTPINRQNLTIDIRILRQQQNTHGHLLVRTRTRHGHMALLLDLGVGELALLVGIGFFGSHFGGEVAWRGLEVADGGSIAIVIEKESVPQQW